MVRFAVIGGGISGLAAAHRLLELDPQASVSVMESHARVGGVLRTEHLDGYCIEAGPDSMLRQLPWGVDLCRRLGLDDELIGTNREQQRTWIVRKSRLVALPEGLAIMAPQRLWPTLCSPILSVSGKLRLACEPLVRPRQEAADESLASFASRRVGREAFERLVQPLVSGIYMADPKRLSMQAALPRFVAMESEHGSLMRAARAAKAARAQEQQRTTGPPASMFVAPRRGMEALVSALVRRLPHGAIRCNSKVQEVTPRPQGGWQLRGQAPQGPIDESFDGVIVATPSNRAAELLGPTDATLANALSAIEHSGCLVVVLAFDRDQVSHPLDGHGFVVPHVERRDIVACTFSSVKYTDRAPEGRVLMRVFLGGALRADLLALADDQEVVRLAMRELRRLIGLRGEPQLARVYRWPDVMPQYHVGHLDRVEALEATVANFPGLELAGNSYRGVGIPHCIHSGEQAAERLHESTRNSNVGGVGRMNSIQT